MPLCDNKMVKILRKGIDIRQFYTPIQPTVRQADESVSYCEFLPDIKLQEFIYCYWQLNSLSPLLEPFNYRVVADGCIDIFFDLDDLDESFIMGFCKKYTKFPLEKTFNYVGIRFLPTMFPQLFKIKASELSNYSEYLSVVLPVFADFIRSRFNPHLTTEGIKDLLDNYFFDHLSHNNINNDFRLYTALNTILCNVDRLYIEKDLDSGISSRHLRRLFDFYVGCTPKAFSQVIRFQKVLNTDLSLESLRLHKPFFDAGYYDQTHFIKEFKLFYGLTPSHAFSK